MPRSWLRVPATQSDWDAKASLADDGYVEVRSWFG